MSGSNGNGHGTPRVAITGIGAVTPLGLDAESTWQSCRRGQGGIGPITAFDASHLTTQIAGQVKGFDPEAVSARRKRAGSAVAPSLGFLLHVRRSRIPVSTSGRSPRTSACWSPPESAASR